MFWPKPGFLDRKISPDVSLWKQPLRMKRTKEVLEQVLLEHCFPISYWLGLDSCTTEEQGQEAVLQGSLSHGPWMTVRLVGQCHTDGVPSHCVQQEAHSRIGDGDQDQPWPRNHSWVPSDGSGPESSQKFISVSQRATLIMFWRYNPSPWIMSPWPLGQLDSW